MTTEEKTLLAELRKRFNQRDSLTIEEIKSFYKLLNKENENKSFVITELRKNIRLNKIKMKRLDKLRVKELVQKAKNDKYIRERMK